MQVWSLELSKCTGRRTFNCVRSKRAFIRFSTIKHSILSPDWTLWPRLSSKWTSSFQVFHTSPSIISLALETKSAHRTSAAHFRDINNLPLFETALTYLPTVSSPDGLHLSVDQVYITEAALRLINAILSFDYLGSQTDGNDEEVSLLHLPSCWSSVICDSSLPELFGLL